MSQAFECDADGELHRGDSFSEGEEKVFVVEVSLPDGALNPEWRGERQTKFRITVKMISAWDYCEVHRNALIMQALRAALEEARGR